MEHQPRDRAVKCVGLHSMRRRPWTSHHTGLCGPCLQLRRDGMHEQARTAAALSAYPFDQEDQQK